MKIITTKEMRRLEQEFISVEGHDAELHLMTNAGINTAYEIIRWVRAKFHYRPRFLVFAGKGNNGGDGFVIAGTLAKNGYQTEVYSLQPLDSLKYPSNKAAEALPDNVPFSELHDNSALPVPQPDTVIIDALLGIGINGNARGLCKEIIELINNSRLPVVSVDLPSGLDSDTGLGSPVVRADMTVTMECPKTGLFLEQGRMNAGTLRVIPIGLKESAAPRGTQSAFGTADAAKLLHRRPADSHKYTFGHLLCLAGSKQYPGAPFLAAEAALRSGAGLVTLAAPETALRRQGSAALIQLPLTDGDFFTESMIPRIKPLMDRITAMLYGPGTGAQASPGFLEFLLKQPQPLLLDADGLRLLASDSTLIDALKNRKSTTVLTPHPGEMRALLKGFALEKYLESAPAEQAAALADTSGASVLLKGRYSAVAAPGQETTLNLSGNPALATAGTGDVLAGIAGALLAQGMAGADALRLAAYIHGYAADLFPGAELSMIADDLISLLPEAFCL